jgi:hypothetical protein
MIWKLTEAPESSEKAWISKPEGIFKPLAVVSESDE